MLCKPVSLACAVAVHVLGTFPLAEQSSRCGVAASQNPFFGFLKLEFFGGTCLSSSVVISRKIGVEAIGCTK